MRASHPNYGSVYILTNSIVYVVGLKSTAAQQFTSRIAVYEQQHVCFMIRSRVTLQLEDILRAAAINPNPLKLKILTPEPLPFWGSWASSTLVNRQ